VLRNSGFKRKQTFGPEITRRLGDDVRQIGDSVFRRRQGLRRLETAHLRRRLRGFRGRKIRRVGNNEVERLDRHTGKPVRGHEINPVAEPGRRGILLGEGEGQFTPVYGRHPRRREDPRQGQGNGTRSRAEIENPSWGRRRDARLHPLHELLGFRTGNQRPPIDLELEPIKLGFSRDILQRFVQGTTADERTNFLKFRFRQRSLEFEIELHALPRQGVAHEKFRVQTGRLDPLARQELRRLLDDLQHRQHLSRHPARRPSPA